MFFRALAVLALGLTMTVGHVREARAASILIDAGNIVELTTFTFGQFEGGFSINGSTPTSGGSFTFGDNTQLNFTGQWIDLSAAISQSRTVYWTDAAYPGNYVAILQWSITPSGASGLATISGFFNAEDDGGLGALPGGVSPSDVIVMNTSLTHDPFQFSAPFLSGRVITGRPDADPQVNPVPLPATGLLLFGALAGLAATGRRSRNVRGAA